MSISEYYSFPWNSGSREEWLSNMTSVAAGLGARGNM